MVRAGVQVRAVVRVVRPLERINHSNNRKYPCMPLLQFSSTCMKYLNLLNLLVNTNTTRHEHEHDTARHGTTRTRHEHDTNTTRTRHDTTRHDTARHGTTRHDTNTTRTRHGTTRHGTNTTRHDTARVHGTTRHDTGAACYIVLGQTASSRKIQTCRID